MKIGNKKGFTLVELLAVIVILALLITIAVPSTIGISNKIKKNMYCSKIDSIENAAKLYGEDRKDSFKEQYTATEKNAVTGEESSIICRSTTIKVIDLIQSGDLKKEGNTSPFVTDPRDNSSMEDLELIVYEKYNRIYVAFSDEIKTTCDK